MSCGSLGAFDSADGTLCQIRVFDDAVFQAPPQATPKGSSKCSIAAAADATNPVVTAVAKLSLTPDDSTDGMLCRSPTFFDLSAAAKDSSKRSITAAADAINPTATPVAKLVLPIAASSSSSSTNPVENVGSARVVSSTRQRLSTSELPQGIFSQKKKDSPKKIPHSLDTSGACESSVVTWTIGRCEQTNFTLVTQDFLTKISSGERLALYQRLQQLLSGQEDAQIQVVREKLALLEGFWKAQREKTLLHMLVKNENNFQAILVETSFLLMTNDELLQLILADIKKNSAEGKRVVSLTQFYLALIATFQSPEKERLAFQKLTQAHDAHDVPSLPLSPKTHPLALTSSSSFRAPPAFDFLGLQERIQRKDKQVLSELAVQQRLLCSNVKKHDLCYDSTPSSSSTVCDLGSFKTLSQPIHACISFNGSLKNALVNSLDKIRDKKDYCKKLLELANESFNHQDFATTFSILQALENERLADTIKALTEEKLLLPNSYKKIYAKLRASYPAYWKPVALKAGCIHCIEVLCQELQTVKQLPSFLLEQEVYNFEKLRLFYEILKMFS